MLILSRRKDEQVAIGGGVVRVLVVEIRPTSVRLGIAAPPYVPIHRQEVQRLAAPTLGHDLGEWWAVHKTSGRREIVWRYVDATGTEQVRPTRRLAAAADDYRFLAPVFDPFRCSTGSQVSDNA